MDPCTNFCLTNNLLEKNTFKNCQRLEVVDVGFCIVVFQTNALELFDNHNIEVGSALGILKRASHNFD